MEVPEGAEGEVARVLQSEDYYEVLGVPTDADAETLKRAKRQKSLSTHPDKLHQAPGSNEAFARVTEVGLPPMWRIQSMPVLPASQNIASAYLLCSRGKRTCALLS